jgi:hypothetical protein
LQQPIKLHYELHKIVDAWFFQACPLAAVKTGVEFSYEPVKVCLSNLFFSY